MDVRLSVQKEDCTRHDEKMCRVKLELFALMSYWSSPKLAKIRYRFMTSLPRTNPSRMESTKVRSRRAMSTLPAQKGFDERWWRGAMECKCHKRSSKDPPADEKNLHE